MDEKTVDLCRQVPCLYDDLLIRMRWCTVYHTLDCGDAKMNEELTVVMANGPLVRIYLRIAGKWYTEHEGISLLFRRIVRLLPKLVNCLECLDVETISHGPGKHQWDDELWRNESIELHGGVVHIHRLIKQEAEKVFQVPKSQLANSLQPHQLLGVFLSFVQVNLQELLKSRIEFTDKEDLTLNGGSGLLFLKLRTDTIASSMYQIARLAENLSFLVTFLGDTPLRYTGSQNVKFIDVLNNIEVVANKAGHFCFLFFADHKMSSMEVSLLLSDLLQFMELIKAQVKKCVEEFQPATCRSWRTNQSVMQFGNAHLEPLKKFIQHNPSLIVLKYKVEFLSRELESLTHFLMNQQCENEDLKDLVAHLADVRNMVEYLIDSFVVQVCPLWYFDHRFSQIIEEIQLIKTKKANIEEKNKSYVTEVQEAAAEILVGQSSQAVNPLSTKVMVDFGQEQEIKDQLLGEPSRLTLFSIVGMPGLGKTTLAKKIYDDPTFVSNFPIRLWCTVSRSYQKRHLVLDILCSMNKLTDDMYKQEAEDLQETLYKLLKEKEKYLIILDDVWDTKPWDDFKVSFPDNNAGSRIIFTSRSEDLDFQYEPYYKFKHTFLSEKVCWHLLKRNVFQHGKCPSELKEDGKEIAKKCQGLPLLVHLVAGLLREEREACSWRKVSTSLTSRIAGDANVSRRLQEQTEILLAQSYMNIPDIRRPCFLYCGAFPKEKSFPARKLIRLWVAEGFIMKTGQESLENAAERWLTDLINTSLLLVADRRSNGSIKSCRVHALVHDFCLKKAEEVKFLKVIDSSFAIYQRHRRLAITEPHCSDINNAIPFGSHVCSLLGLFTYDFLNGLSDVSFLIRGLKLLKVLDLESIRVAYFPSEIGKLVLLKYLAIRGDFPTFPASVGNLWNLETFILNGQVNAQPDVNDNLTGVLDAIQGMSKVRHLYLASDERPLKLYKDPHKTYQFQTVQTLSGVRVSGLGADESLRCFPNLRKLKCTFGYVTVGSLSKSRFPVLDFFEKLEILHIFYERDWRKVRPTVTTLRLPNSLRQLTLSTLELPWKEMSVIGRLLLNLEVLKLLNKSFTGEEWDMESDVGVEFPELKFLKLQGLDIRKWRVACGDQLPKLQQLVLRECSRLEEIPIDSFAEMYCLQGIDMQGCTSSAIESAKQIKQQQEEYGNENFKLIFRA